MWSSMVFGSLILLLLGTEAYGLGRLDMQLHTAQHQQLHKEDSQKEEIPADFARHQRPPSSPPGRRRRPAGVDASDSQNGLGGRTTPEHSLTTSTGRAAEKDGEVKKKMRRTHRGRGPGGVVAIHEDYVGPSGHSPNNHRAIPCGPCKH